MKKIKYFSLLALVLFTLFSCKKDDDKPFLSYNEVSEVVLNPQKERYELFTTLLSSMDTTSALNEVLNEFIEDPNVDWAKAGRQGIAVQYKNGIRGGLLVNPLNSPEYTGTETLKLAAELKSAENYSNFKKTVPESKKAIFIAPTYTEFEIASEILVENYDDYLPKIGYEPIEVIKDTFATFDKFTNLNEYGVIHFSSHGVAWPDENNIEEVFLLTGQKYSQAFHNEYAGEIANGGVIGIIYSDDVNEVFINVDFIINRNDFKNTDQLIFGEFCYSGLGNWPEMLNDAGVSGYFGFDWSVSSRYSALWNILLMRYLTNTDVTIANSTLDWMNNTVAKYYWDDNIGRYVSITYLGLSDLALFDPEDIESPPWTKCGVQVDVLGHYSESSEGSTDEYDSESSFYSWEAYTGSFSANTFTGTYSRSYGTTYVVSGNISAVLSFDNSIIETLTWTEERISSQGSGSTVTESFTVENIPEAWSEVFQIQGEDVCDHIESLTSELNSDDGVNRSLLSWDCNGDSKIYISFSE